jgi:hypothetical protein
MPPSLACLSAAQRQRLAYIEFKVWFHGTVTRKDVQDRFEVATAAGTRDLIIYRELAPDNVVYERKAYRYQPGFKPLFEHSVDRVLSALTTGLSAGELPSTGAQVSHSMPTRLNQPDLATLATVTRAIRGGQVLQLRYHSMKTGSVPRMIVPHALVDSGLRWHVRAFDRTLGEFRDLVLTRMDDVQLVDTDEGALVPKHERVDADVQWHQRVSLTLVPHPAHPHPASIEKDFAMKAGELTVTLKAVMAGYVLRQWQVDCSPDAHLNGAAFRLWLKDARPLVGLTSAALAPGYEEPVQK